MAQVRVAAQGRKVRAAQVRAVVRVWPVAAPVRVAQRLLCEDGPCEVCNSALRRRVCVSFVVSLVVSAFAPVAGGLFLGKLILRN